MRCRCGGAQGGSRGAALGPAGGRCHGHDNLVAVQRPPRAQNAIGDVHARSHRGLARIRHCDHGRGRGPGKRAQWRKRCEFRADLHVAAYPRGQLRVGAQAQQQEARDVDERRPKPVPAQAADKEVSPTDNVACGNWSGQGRTWVA